MISNSAFSSPAVHVKPIPRRIGRFVVTDKLGNGSNGTVYLGHDPVIDRDVAIKLMAESVGLIDKKQREQQFINEARAAGRLSHPNIVTIFDASTENGTTFIAMEFLQGQDLRELLASEKRFDQIDTLRIIHQIAQALAYAHEKGVIHRDIKPANIFILPNQQPKVLDFGIARVPNRVLDDSGQPGHTLFNNNVLGTPNYMSPEQALSQPVTALTDVYSLGAVMYEMLTQKKPFQSNDIDKLLQMIAHKNPRPPHLVEPRVSEKLSQIVMKALQKNPAMRYANAGEMANAIQKLIERDERLKRKGHKRRKNADIIDNPSTDEKSVVFWFYCAVLVLAVVLVLFTIKR